MPHQQLRTSKRTLSLDYRIRKRTSARLPNNNNIIHAHKPFTYASFSFAQCQVLPHISQHNEKRSHNKQQGKSKPTQLEKA